MWKRTGLEKVRGQRSGSLQPFCLRPQLELKFLPLGPLGFGGSPGFRAWGGAKYPVIFCLDKGGRKFHDFQGPGQAILLFLAKMPPTPYSSQGSKDTDPHPHMMTPKACALSPRAMPTRVQEGSPRERPCYGHQPLQPLPSSHPPSPRKAYNKICNISLANVALVPDGASCSMPYLCSLA